MSDPAAEQTAVRLMIVDDDVDILEMARHVGARVPGIGEIAVFSSAATAAVAVWRHPPDAVLLDVQVAEDDGLELVPLINQVAPRAVVVLYTAVGSPEVVKVPGVDAVLEKDIYIGDALVLLRDLVAARRAST